jgi:hypothetical protein
MIWFVAIFPVQWLRIYNNVVLYRLSVDSSYTTDSLWPSSLQYQSTKERLLSTQNNKNTTPLSMLAQVATRHTCTLGSAVPNTFDARTIQNEVSVESLSLSRRIPSYYLELCQLDFLPSLVFTALFFSRHYRTTAAERVLNIKFNKEGNGREALSSKHCGRGNSVSIRYSEYVPVIPALVIRTEERMRRIMSSVVCVALTRVFTLPYIRHHFRNTFTENKNV